ncbi:hypothetical protein [Gymnodinialimonas sp.]
MAWSNGTVIRNAAVGTLLTILAPISTAHAQSPQTVQMQALTCFATHFESFRAATPIDSIVVVDFAACPEVPDTATILETILALMDAGVVNSLGTITFADDAPSDQQVMGFPVAQATCLRDLVVAGSFEGQDAVDLSGLSCFVGD